MSDNGFNIDFDFQSHITQYVDDVLGPRPAMPGKPLTLEQSLRDQITFARLHSPSPDCPDRIRITELCPDGQMFVAPYERDGSVPSLDRRVTDGGPKELLVNPTDWETMVKNYVPADAEHWRLFEGQYMGIPVMDDTIETRSKG